MSPWCLKRLDEFGGDISRFRVVKVSPSRLRQIAHRQDRAGRREQPGHLLAGRQGRHPQAGDAVAERPGRLQLLGRAEPGQPGHPRIRRDVQGADQDAAPAADRDAGGQLHRHREHRRDPVHRASSWPTPTRRSGRASRPTRTTKPSSTASTSSRCPYCLRVDRGAEDLREADPRLRARRRALRARRRWRCWRGSRCCRACASTRTPTSSPRCGSMTARACRRSIPRARSLQEYRDAAGVDEGMDGVSTRFAFKVLAATFNHDTTEIAADPVHLMYVLEQAIRREQLPDDDREALSRVHQGRAGAALRRVHRQRDPEGLSRILPRLRPEPVRPLRRLRRRLDRGPGLQGSRYRPAAQPRAAEPGADQDREAGRHRQPQGFPQRGGEVRAARARQQRRPEPVLDQLREDPRGDREADVQPGRGTAAGDQLRLQEGQRDARRSTANSSSAWSRAATPSGRSAGWSSGTCG